jgi:hypothetical protein
VPAIDAFLESPLRAGVVAHERRHPDDEVLSPSMTLTPDFSRQTTCRSTCASTCASDVFAAPPIHPRCRALPEAAVSPALGVQRRLRHPANRGTTHPAGLFTLDASTDWQTQGLRMFTAVRSVRRRPAICLGLSGRYSAVVVHGRRRFRRRCSTPTTPVRSSTQQATHHARPPSVRFKTGEASAASTADRLWCQDSLAYKGKQRVTVRDDSAPIPHFLQHSKGQLGRRLDNPRQQALPIVRTYAI